MNVLLWSGVQLALTNDGNYSLVILHSSLSSSLNFAYLLEVSAAKKEHPRWRQTTAKDIVTQQTNERTNMFKFNTVINAIL